MILFRISDFLNCFTLLWVISCQISSSHAFGEDWVSPCPREFSYDYQLNQNGKWFGLVKLLPNSDVKGVRLKLFFDGPSIQLGNWFGSVETADHIEYLIKNENFELKARQRHRVRIFVQFDPNQEPPKLLGFTFNDIQVCPASGGGFTPAPATPRPSQSNNANNGGGDFIFPGEGRPSRPTKPPSSTNQQFFPGDFNILGNKQTENSNNRFTGNQVLDLGVQCGTVVHQPRPLITYGEATTEGEFPWHTALYHSGGTDLTYICGGSLVSKYHVITAAHCVTLPKSSTPLDPDNLLLYFGKYYLRRWSNPGIQDRQVTSIIKHPEYNGNTYSNDIALLKVGKEIEFNDYVRPLCLWEGSDDVGHVVDKLGTVIGWGFDETGKLSEKLTQAKMPVVNKETCIYSYPDFYSRFTTAKTYCAGFRNGTSVCNGDSGGGMVFPKDQNAPRSPWVLRGLVSISVALQNQFRCDSTHYVVFTDVAKYSDWIQQAMKN